MAVVPRIGTEFAGYRIEALLGRGGMSVVYRAENARLGSKVALKLLAESLADDESFRERFVRESRTAATLNHPNIVTIYDAGDWEGVLYIAMRWVEEDLKAHLRREGPLAPDHALAVAAQVGSALDAAHARGLLHRDVKPANILLEPGEPGAPPIAYLADFGLTKHLESRSGITASGQFVGTIDYMSPEQIEGREVDSRTDIYSLGCVIFESLAEATPFRRETEVAVLWAHMREDPPPLTEVRPDLPRELDDVLAMAMAKQPEDRYGACRELVADLRRALGAAAIETYAGRTAVEAGEAPATVAARTARQRPEGAVRGRLLPVLGAIALLLLAGLAGYGVHELIFEPETRVVAAAGTGLSADEVILGRNIPIPLGLCRKTEPLTEDFSAGFVCRPRDTAARRIHYYKPVSGRRMIPYFEKRAVAEGLATPGLPLQPVRHCGAPPALREWRRKGKTGHRPVDVGETGADGRFLCYRQNNWAAIEWTDNDVDVYSIAFGRDLIRLRRWWEDKAGPIQPD
jgi:Protein kinase domain